MALKKNEKRMLMILGVVVSAAIINYVISGSSNKKPQVSKSDSIKKEMESVPAQTLPKTTPSIANFEVKVKRFDNWGRDPFSIVPAQKTVSFAAQSKKKEETPKPKLKGIFWKQGRAYVLLDDFILREGEEKKGILVQKVQGTEVLCSQGNQSFTLRWRESP